jgi:hypothetical protein
MLYIVINSNRIGLLLWGKSVNYKDLKKSAQENIFIEEGWSMCAI